FGFFHAVSAFCNAGFDLFGPVYGKFSSITHYVNDWVVTLTIGALIVFGGLGFPVIIELVKYPKTKKLSLNAKLVLRVTALLIVTGALLIYIMEATNGYTLGKLGFSGKFLGSLFQSITPRTAGYNSLDISHMRKASWFVLTILMFIGASPSSTGGGIKTTTFGVIIATVIATIRGKHDVELSERRLTQELLNKAFTITFIALSWVYLVTLIISIVEPFDFLRIFFDVMSAFGTVGLTTGITPYLSGISQIMLILTMFIGRVGPLTVMVAITDVKHKKTGRYITDHVMIG
ncbi:MAG: TrkH family potassium uptake protein, partial [Bacillota bacterium]